MVRSLVTAALLQSLATWSFNKVGANNMYYGKKQGETKIGVVLFVGCFVLIVMAAIAYGGAAEEPAGAVASANTEAAETPAGAAEVGIFKDGRLSLIAFEKDTTITDAIRVLAALYKKNIVPSPNITGTLSFTRLRDVTFEEAMEAILGQNFKYEQRGNLTNVYTKAEYEKIMADPARMVYEIFTLYYITAEEAKKLITPVLSGSGKIETSTAAEAGISVGSSGSSGASSSSSGAGSSMSSAGGGNSLALHDTIVVHDYPENIEKAAEVIAALDVRPQQVLVEATILSVLLTEQMELGVDLNFLGGVNLNGDMGTETIVAQNNISRGREASSPMLQVAEGTAGSAIETYGFATIGGNGLRIGVRAGDVTAFITALEGVTDITVLANPKILAVNKQEGNVLIGTNLGYRSSTTVGVGGVATEGEVEFLQTGTQLVFRPYIGNDGYIRMLIYPKDSSADLNEDGVPTENTAQLLTNVLVKDGQTIVIGGLFRDVVTTSREQVPLLGNLPILGALFRSTSDLTQRQEVIVLLTPHIVKEPSETDGQARAEDVRRKRFGAKDATQIIGRGRLAEECYASAAKHYIAGDHEAAMRRLKIALTLRPTYLEAIRLKERIMAETDPSEVETLQRIILEDIDRQEASKWLRW